MGRPNRRCACKSCISRSARPGDTPAAPLHSTAANISADAVKGTPFRAEQPSRGQGRAPRHPARTRTGHSGLPVACFRALQRAPCGHRDPPPSLVPALSTRRPISRWNPDRLSLVYWYQLPPRAHARQRPIRAGEASAVARFLNNVIAKLTAQLIFRNNPRCARTVHSHRSTSTRQNTIGARGRALAVARPLF